MVRNSSPRFLATLMLSSMAVVFFLTGCSNSNKSKGSGYSSGLKRLSPGRLSRNKTVAQLPTKVSPRASRATKLARSFSKNPANSRVALDYIYTLRSLGMQQQAIGILHRAYQANPKHPVISSEYGRLLLGSGKTTQAKRVLARIDNDKNPDWHTLSALGTIEARDGKYAKATKYFRQARVLAPKKASVLNNLALSIALGGNPDEAENLLRNADDSGRFGARLRQNLALVLALQGKYDEAQAMATTDLSPKQAKTNIAYLKKMLATSDSHSGVELTDETAPPRANAMAYLPDDGPATTASISAPTSLLPKGQ